MRVEAIFEVTGLRKRSGPAVALDGLLFTVLPPSRGRRWWSRPGLARAWGGWRGPATGTQGPASFGGVIDGGTARFAAAHGTFHAATLPDGDMQITAVIDAGQR